MSGFGRINGSRRVVRGIRKIDKQIEAIKKSNLSAEEKEKALNSLKRMSITTVIVVIAVAILLTIMLLLGLFIGGDPGVILIAVSLVVAVVVITGYALISRKIFKDFPKYYSIVSNNFDGLSEQEINGLKPNEEEKALIRKYKAKRIIYILILLLALGIEFYIIWKLDLPINSPVIYIVTIVLFVVWFIFEDTCKVEIHRIESGRYKREFGFRCAKCRTELHIKFSEMEKYMNVPKNDYGIRVVSCPNCGNPIPLYNLEANYNEYINYQNQIK